MLITYHYKLNPTPKQAATMALWGELLSRHWNYALGQRLDWLSRTRSPVDRCSLVAEPIGECKFEKPPLQRSLAVGVVTNDCSCMKW